MTDPLSIREVIAVHLIATGHSTARAARAMYVSERTVKDHLHTASVALGTRERAHTVAEAFRHGYLTLDPINHEITANPYGRRPQRFWDRVESYVRGETDE